MKQSNTQPMRLTALSSGLIAQDRRLAARRMLSFEQLELTFHPPQQFSAFASPATGPPDASKTAAIRLGRVALFRSGRDFELEARAQEILHSLGDTRLSHKIRVEWNVRLRS